MIQRFWRSIIGIAFVSLVFTSLSWTYLYLNHISLSKPNGIMQLLKLPTDFPSIWNIVLPNSTSAPLAPFVVLILQVLLTGGLFGSLIRLNTHQEVSGATFTADGLRSFWRLLVWNIIWSFLLPLFVVGFTKIFPPAGLVLSVLALITRFLFFFGDIALVSEGQYGMGIALKLAFQALMAGILPLLPYAILVIFLSAAALDISTGVSMPLFGLIAALYSILMVWILHMVVARYLYFSRRYEESEAISSSV